MTGAVSLRLRARSRTVPAPAPAGALLEVLLVVALVAALCAFSTAMGNSLRARHTATFARGIARLLLRARAGALVDGNQRRVRCGPLGCFLDVATTAGMPPPAHWQRTPEQVATGPTFGIWAIDRDPDPAGPLPAPLAGTVTLTLFPDGSATPATLYLCDADRRQRFQVKLDGPSGLARVLARW